MSSGVTLPPEVLVALRKFEGNMQWAFDHDAELERSRGQFVAIADGKIVGSAKSVMELNRRFRQDRSDVYVHFMAPKDWALVL